MATVKDLAIRALKKATVLGAQETAAPADLQLAVAAVHAAHQHFIIDDLVRWTLNDIPEYAEEPYIWMTAFIVAPDFGFPADQNLAAAANIQLARAANLPATGVTPAEYF